MSETIEKIDVSSFVHKKILHLDLNTSASNAALSKLCRAVGKNPEETPDIWDITLQGAPSSWDSRTGGASREELAVHTALTLYAMHRQGKGHSMNTKGVSLGSAAGSLIKKDRGQEAPITRRFNMIATASGFDEFVYHSRGLIQLLKRANIKIDYSQFAKDLYLFQFPEYTDKVRLRWGEDFYKFK